MSNLLITLIVSFSVEIFVADAMSFMDPRVQLNLVKREPRYKEYVKRMRESEVLKNNRVERDIHIEKRLLGGQNYTGINNHYPLAIIRVNPDEWDYSDDIWLPCGGALVDYDLVLTAAVCMCQVQDPTAGPNYQYTDYDSWTVKYYSKEKFKISLGEKTYDENDEQNSKDVHHSDIEEIRHAVGFNWVIVGNDLAVLKLSRPITTIQQNNTNGGGGGGGGSTGPWVAPPCYLYYDKWNITNGTKGIVLGYGRMWDANTNNITDGPSNDMQFLDVEVESMGDGCKKHIDDLVSKDATLYGNWSTIEYVEDLMCLKATSGGSGGQNTTVCDYDTGGGIYFGQQTGDGYANEDWCTGAVVSTPLLCISEYIIATHVSHHYHYLMKPENLSLPDSSDWNSSIADYVLGNDSGSNSAEHLAPQMTLASLLAIHAAVYFVTDAVIKAAPIQ